MGHRLIQVGAALFLFALILGLGVPLFSVPRLALSSHLLAITQGLFLMVAGLVWPRLSSSQGTQRVTFWLLIYGCLAALSANLLAASLGAGNSVLPIAAGQAHGTAAQELLVTVVLRSGGVALIVGTTLFLAGLRGGSTER